MDDKLEAFRGRAKQWMKDRDQLSDGPLDPLTPSKQQHIENAALVMQVWSMACAFIAEDIDEYVQIYEFGRLGRRGRAIAAEFYGFADGIISDAFRPEGLANHPDDGSFRIKKARDRFIISSILLLKLHNVRGVYRELSAILKAHGIKQAELSIKKKWLAASNESIRRNLPQLEVTDVLLTRYSNFTAARLLEGRSVTTEDILEFLSEFWKHASGELPERAKR